jgi:4-amino-4-deoxy-L-arabinose transferase-like glycosyltransferase
VPAVPVALAAALVFGWSLSSEPSFADEQAYLTQSYYAGLFAAGRHDDAEWLAYAAYDLPPLPKYLIGLGLWAGRYDPPGPAQARAWYSDINRRFDSPGMLAAARWPILLVGVAGCLGLYGLGVLAGGRPVGVLAALFLMANPLFRLHARRAMSDVPCESFVLLALAFGLLGWSRTLSGRPAWRAGVGVVLAGVCAGLAVLSKLSGLLAPIVLWAWADLASVVPAPAGRKLAVALSRYVTPALALAVVVALNPYLTANPASAADPSVASIARMSLLERAAYTFRVRLGVSAGQQEKFADDALRTLPAKVATVAVQGFGRFGLFGPSHFDSRVRYDPRQDLGAVVWLPWVLAGAVWAAARGRAQWAAGEPPTAWAALVHFAVAVGVVTVYLPMAWDRYQLPIQAPACLLAAGVTVAAARRLVRQRPSAAPAAVPAPDADPVASPLAG